MDVVTQFQSANDQQTSERSNDYRMWKHCAFAVALTITIITLVLTLAFCTRSIRFFKSLQSLTQSSQYRLWIVSMIVMSLSCAYLGNLAYQIESNESNDIDVSIMEVCFGIIFGLFYVSLLLRVHVAFRYYPKLRLSPRLNCTIIGLIVLGECAIFFALLIFRKYRYRLGATIIFGLVIVIVIDTLILYVFLSRLYRMILSLDESYHGLIIDIDNYRQNSKSSNNGDIELEVKNDDDSDVFDLEQKAADNKATQEEIVDLMAKISFLTLIEEMLFHSWVIPRYTMIIYQKFTGHYNENIALLLTAMQSINIGFLCLVLYFTFGFNNQQYMLCCKIFHECMKKCCRDFVSRRAYHAYTKTAGDASALQMTV